MLLLGIPHASGKETILQQAVQWLLGLFVPVYYCHAAHQQWQRWHWLHSFGQWATWRVVSCHLGQTAHRRTP